MATTRALIVNNPVPHLETALTGPLHEIEQHLLKKQVEIETWFRKAWKNSPAPINSSVDLRNAGFKLSPIDTNLFPAGFNNLNPDFMPLSIQAMQTTLEQYYPGCERILLIPENHTRNLFYFESLAVLQEIIRKAGFDVKIGSLLPEINKKTDFNLPSGKKITLEPIQRKQNTVCIENFIPCLILLNNDLSEGIPDILTNVRQKISPATKLGWSTRLKSIHFQHYDKIANEFSAMIDIDPWLINPLFRHCGEINFKTREGEDCLAQYIQEILNQIEEKYKQYNIKQQPFVIVKADAGTYGMGVMTISSPEQIRQLNRKQREKMSSGKGKTTISKVLIQEGVYSFETWGDENAVAEPVVYSIGQHVIGGFYRIHKQRSPQESLNAPGMEFEPLAFANSCNNPNQNMEPNETPNRFYAYGVIARLAVLAAARENQEIQS